MPNTLGTQHLPGSTDCGPLTTYNKKVPREFSLKGSKGCMWKAVEILSPFWSQNVLACAILRAEKDAIFLTAYHGRLVGIATNGCRAHKSLRGLWPKVTPLESKTFNVCP